MKLLMGVVAAVTLALPGSAIAQDAAAEVDCSEILATPSASAEEIAALNDTTVVTVQRCQAAEVEDGAVADLRAAVAANQALTPTFTAAGAAAEQVVAFRRNADGAVTFYVIGGYR